MAGLLYKEFVINKKNLIMIAFSEVGVSLLLVLPLIFKDDSLGADIITGMFSVFVFFMMFMMFGMMSATIFETDETKKWAYFVTSTPLSVKGQIASKYLFTLIIYLGLFAYCCVLSLLLSLLGGDANTLIAFEMLWIMLLSNAVEFPFLVRFGCKAGSYVKSAIGLALIMLVFEYIFFGDISVFTNGEKLFELMDKLSDPMRMAGISIIVLALIPLVSAAAYLISYKLSCKFYLKGAEEYER